MKKYILSREKFIDAYRNYKHTTNMPNSDVFVPNR